MSTSKKKHKYIAYLRLRLEADKPEVAQKLQQLEATDPELIDYGNQMGALEEKLSHMEAGFQPFFVSRTLSKINQSAREANLIWHSLPTAFRWVATPALAFMLAMVFYQASASSELSIDTFLGTQAISWEDLAYENSIH